MQGVLVEPKNSRNKSNQSDQISKQVLLLLIIIDLAMIIK